MYIWSAYTGGGAADIIGTAVLALAAFWLGALPFSLWVGRWLLGQDIRDCGDGNPGAVNVFRSGGRKAGCLALVLDVVKGVPFVLLAQSYFGLPEAAVLVVALSAILGSAFSPFLRFRGGKSVAVTFGVLVCIQPPVMLIALAAFLLLGSVAFALPPAMAINWWVMGGGESGRSSASLRINATIGQPAIGRSSSGPLALSWGYWAGQGSVVIPRGYLPLVLKQYS